MKKVKPIASLWQRTLKPLLVVSLFFDRCVPLCNVQRLRVIKVRFPTGSNASLLRWPSQAASGLGFSNMCRIRREQSPQTPDFSPLCPEIIKSFLHLSAPLSQTMLPSLKNNANLSFHVEKHKPFLRLPRSQHCAGILISQRTTLTMAMPVLSRKIR